MNSKTRRYQEKEKEKKELGIPAKSAIMGVNMDDRTRITPQRPLVLFHGVEVGARMWCSFRGGEDLLSALAIHGQMSRGVAIGPGAMGMG